MSESSKDYDAVVDIVSSTSVVQRRKSSSRRPSRDIDFAKERTRRKSETEQMRALNNDLVDYVTNVHELEHMVESLRTENATLWEKYKQSEPKVDVKAIFESHMKKLASEVDKRVVLNKQLAVEHLNIKKDLGSTFLKIGNATNENDVLSNDIQILRKEIDNLSVDNEELKAKIYVLEKQLILENTVHKANIENLTKVISASRNDLNDVIKINSIENPDVSDLVMKSRSQFVDLSTKSNGELVEYYKEKLETLNTQIAVAQKSMVEVKKKKIDNTRHLDGISFQINPLKRQTAYLEDIKTELEDELAAKSKEIEEEIEDLRLKLRNIKQDVGGYLKQYQDLMIVKLGLDQEIAIYHELIASKKINLKVNTKLIKN